MDRQNQVIESFQKIENWEEKYKKIIDLGKSLKDIDENYRTEQLKVKGCQSQVWLHAELSSEGRLSLQADSDALIVKGLVALLLKIYNDASLDEVLQEEPRFIEALGFKSNLSPSRTNGLFAMIKQIKLYALAFKMMKK